MSNPAIPGLLKIGESGVVTERQKTLSTSNVPMDYRILHFRFCHDVRRAEKEVFKALFTCRVNTGKEFFRINLKKARSIIDDICYDINLKHRLIDNGVAEDELSWLIDHEEVPYSDDELDLYEEK